MHPEPASQVPRPPLGFGSAPRTAARYRQRLRPFAAFGFVAFGMVLLLLGACRPKQSSASAPGTALAGVTKHCTPWATIVRGPYKYENNVWGSNKAKGAYEQCLLEKQAGGRNIVGWTWSWPGRDPSVFAYPEIIFGWKPWSGGRTSDPRFPMRVGDVKELTLRYDVETEATGAYNLAPEIWLTRSGRAQHEPNPKTITTEIMFWMDYASGARPAGSVVGTPSIDGVTYELWKEDSIGDKGDGTGWLLYSFMSPKIQRQGTISVHTLLRYLIDKELVSPDEFVASVEFGNEIVSGSGTTWVNHFEIAVKP